MPPSNLFLLLLRPSGRRFHSLSLSSGPAFAVFGSNTAVGKTLVSTGLAVSILSNPNSSSSFLYLKPIQTGFPSDSDSRFLFLRSTRLLRHSGPTASTSLLLAASNHALFASRTAARSVPGSRAHLSEEDEGEVGPSNRLRWYEEMQIGHDGDGEDRVVGRRRRRLVCKSLYNWSAAVSPHLAVEKEGMAVTDAEVREAIDHCLRSGDGGSGDSGDETWKVVETAGGVASPGPSGTLQCDLYRYMALKRSTFFKAW